MFKDIRRITVYVLVCIPLFIITFLVIRQIQFAFEVKKAFTTTRDIDVNFSVLQQLVALNEHSTRIFFLAFACLLMILCGIIIVLKATDEALSFTKERKVRYSLRTVYPGAAMAIIGCLLLTYSVYQSTQGNFRNELPLNAHQQSSPQLRTSKSVQRHPITTKTERPNFRKESATSNSSNAAAIDSRTGEVLVGKMYVDPIAAEQARQFSESEVRWASELAHRSIIDGSLPTKRERIKYLEIVRNLKGSNNSVHWAFQLLLKTEKGYQPTEAELSKYEMVVTEQLERS